MPTEVDDLYPELQTVGHLGALVTGEFARSGSGLVAAPILDPAGSQVFPKFHARVEHGERASQMYVGAQRRSFSADLWDRGVCYGSAWRDDLSPIIAALVDFVERRTSCDQFEAIHGTDWLLECARLHEAGPEAYVEGQWSALSKRWADDASMTALIEAAHSHPRLRGLLAYTSLNSLCFSYTTGYPFDALAVSVTPRVDGDFVVRQDNGRNRDRQLVVGAFTSANDAAMAIASRLRPGVERARHGKRPD